MFSHHVLGVNNLDVSKSFTTPCSAPWRARRHCQQEPLLLPQPHRHLRYHHPINGEPATHGNGSTIGRAQSPEQADACHAAGVANGGVTCEPSGWREGPGGKLYLPTCATPMATSCACCTALRPEPTPHLLYF